MKKMLSDSFFLISQAVVTDTNLKIGNQLADLAPEKQKNVNMSLLKSFVFTINSKCKH